MGAALVGDCDGAAVMGFPFVGAVVMGDSVDAGVTVPAS